MEPTPAVVSDAAVLAGVEPEIRRNLDDPNYSLMHFLASAGADDPLVQVEVVTEENSFAVEPEVELADGSPAEVDVGPPPGNQRSLSFVAADGRTVSVRSSDLELPELAAIANELEIDGDDVRIDSEDWEVVTSIPIPAYTDGYTTEYDVGDGTVLLTVYRQVGDGMVLFRYGPTVDDEINGETALRFEGVDSVRGFVFVLDDDFIVEVRDLTVAGFLSAEELRSVAESVRAVEPPS